MRALLFTKLGVVVIIVLLLLGGCCSHQTALPTESRAYPIVKHLPDGGWTEYDGCNTCSFDKYGHGQCTLLACQSIIKRPPETER